MAHLFALELSRDLNCESKTFLCQLLFFFLLLYILFVVVYYCLLLCVLFVVVCNLICFLLPLLHVADGTARGRMCRITPAYLQHVP